MKTIAPMFVILGVINGAFALMQGFLLPPEQQAEFSISAKEYFLYSFVILALGIRMYQKSAQLGQDME
tara:strand:+ start:280 stop:483 length:204 start_codon:yes stop_codon:yes gene_type:complete